MRRIVPLLVLAAVVSSPAAAVAGGGGGGACRGFGEGSQLAMLDNCFDAVAHFAPLGIEVDVVNDGWQPHTLTAVDGSFDTGIVEPGAATTLAIDSPGVYRVWCTLHGTASGDGMAGLLVVGEPPPEELAAGSIVADLERRLAVHQEAITTALQDNGRRVDELAERSAELSRIVRAPAPAATDAEPLASAAPAVVVATNDWSAAALGIAAFAGLAAVAALLRSSLARRPAISVGAREEDHPVDACRGTAPAGRLPGSGSRAVAGTRAVP